METSHGDAAAATWIVRGDESRRGSVDIRSRPARAPQVKSAAARWSRSTLSGRFGLWRDETRLLGTRTKTIVRLERQFRRWGVAGKRHCFIAWRDRVLAARSAEAQQLALLEDERAARDRQRSQELAATARRAAARFFRRALHAGRAEFNYCFDVFKKTTLAF